MKGKRRGYDVGGASSNAAFDTRASWTGTEAGTEARAMRRV